MSWRLYFIEMAMLEKLELLLDFMGGDYFSHWNFELYNRDFKELQIKQYKMLSNICMI